MTTIPRKDPISNAFFGFHSSNVDTNTFAFNGDNLYIGQTNNNDDDNNDDNNNTDDNDTDNDDNDDGPELKLSMALITLL